MKASQPLKPRPKLYLAGGSSSDQLDRVDTWAGRLTAVGVDVVSTWTANVRRVGIGNPRNATDADRKRWSLICLNEVASAAVVWFLVPPVDSPTRGAWLEAGWSYCMAKPLVFSGDTKQSVFCSLGSEYPDDESAFGGVLFLLNLGVTA